MLVTLGYFLCPRYNPTSSPTIPRVCGASLLAKQREVVPSKQSMEVTNAEKMVGLVVPTGSAQGQDAATLSSVLQARLPKDADGNVQLTEQYVRQCFKELASREHPDVSEAEDAEQRFQALTAEYAQLLKKCRTNEERRALADSWLRIGGLATAASLLVNGLNDPAVSAVLVAALGGWSWHLQQAGSSVATGSRVWTTIKHLMPAVDLEAVSKSLAVVSREAACAVSRAGERLAALAPLCGSADTRLQLATAKSVLMANATSLATIAAADVLVQTEQMMEATRGSVPLVAEAATQTAAKVISEVQAALELSVDSLEAAVTAAESVDGADVAMDASVGLVTGPASLATETTETAADVVARVRAMMEAVEVAEAAQVAVTAAQAGLATERAAETAANVVNRVHAMMQAAETAEVVQGVETAVRGAETAAQARLATERAAVAAADAIAQSRAMREAVATVSVAAKSAELVAESAADSSSCESAAAVVARMNAMMAAFEAAEAQAPLHPTGGTGVARGATACEMIEATESAADIVARAQAMLRAHLSG
mmetsp:Transcript_605/g.1080  ORF Transcript_605/g.1080 Transcript_605/m.1080 type:complete len:544 (-) Transcript_605:82-1713(-)|eukprot:CAMPEP_0119324748 /NCGR_PEP_ID=MMETSP1333-20130426/64073_1 /TAXON_ID=418940 /ORGANISM="Scyphosphaera apsteinii, Strain RCC1455" /LENGTH=543 /DNA_ID=CAMNT_0007332535 /DNA_START=38 /DNA_END=1669 /DNA_ORIENTATION=-